MVVVPPIGAHHGRANADDALISVPEIARSINAGRDGYNDGSDQTYLVQSFAENQRGELRTPDICPNITNGGGKPGQGFPAIVQSFQTRIARNGRGQPDDIVGAIVSSEAGSHGDSKPHVFGPCGVRRLMPVEEERCMGMPDDWTRYGVKEDGKEVELSDSARYRLIGNSVAVPVVEWIAKRISEF